MKLALILASVAVVTGFGSFETDGTLPGRMTFRQHECLHRHV